MKASIIKCTVKLASGGYIYVRPDSIVFVGYSKTYSKMLWFGARTNLFNGLS